MVRVSAALAILRLLSASRQLNLIG